MCAEPAVCRVDARLTYPIDRGDVLGGPAALRVAPNLARSYSSPNP
jgi:hypothetical protein